ncbi:hypothetical protein ACN47E_008228 [Coniothyrium glycines]
MPAPPAPQLPRVNYIGQQSRFSNWGRRDPQEYQELLSDASGSAQDGNVTVDCRFLFSKTRWGTFENHDSHGGIIYMNLTINHPRNHMLEEAVVSVTLEDEPTSKKPFIRSVEIKNECYGPKHLIGPEITAETVKNWMFGPSVEAVGMGASLGELGNTVTQPRTSWWNFSCTPKSAPGSPQYTTLKWSMVPNTLAYTADYPASIQTAFAFSHSNKPFTLRVDVDATLEHRHKRFKARLKGKHKRSPLMLLFELNGKTTHREQILDCAMSLDQEMTRLACQTKQVQVFPRVSSVDLLESDASSQIETNSGGNHPSSIKQEPHLEASLQAKLQQNHAALLNSGTIQPKHEEKLTDKSTHTPLKEPPNIHFDTTSGAIADDHIPTSTPPTLPPTNLPVSPPIVTTVDDVSLEEVAEALQKIALWMLFWIVRMLRMPLLIKPVSRSTHDTTSSPSASSSSTSSSSSTAKVSPSATHTAQLTIAAPVEHSRPTQPQLQPLNT